MPAGLGRALGTALGTALTLAALAVPAAAQGPGSAGAQLLTITAGGRAAAFAGAYAAVAGDPDAVFYNPAAAAWLDLGVGVGYEEYVEDVVFGSLAGGLSLGRIGLSAGIVYLDAGEIDEIVPDPRFGGERGRLTGSTVGATETAARVALAIPLAERVSAGAALGVVSSDLAGVQRRGLFIDFGAQARFGDVAVGAALRNVGPSLRSGAGATPLPVEARGGVTARRMLRGPVGVLLSSDLVLGLEEESTVLAMGGEVGLMEGGGLTAVLRAGTTVGSDEHLGRFRVGGGVGAHGFHFDYTLQSYEYFGTIHRVGLRWRPGS